MDLPPEATVVPEVTPDTGITVGRSGSRAGTVVRLTSPGAEVLTVAIHPGVGPRMKTSGTVSTTIRDVSPISPKTRTIQVMEAPGKGEEVERIPGYTVITSDGNTGNGTARIGEIGEASPAAEMMTMKTNTDEEITRSIG